MKVKNLIKLLEELDQEKDIITNSDACFITKDSIKDWGKRYCIVGRGSRDPSDG